MSNALVKYAYCLSHGWEAVRHLRDLEKSQWLPAKGIQQIQLQKLRKLVRHAYENVPFYHDKFKEAGLKPKDIRKLVDLEKFPITTKSELKAHPPEKNIANNYNLETLERHQTGGTTGTPFTFFKDRQSSCHELAALCWFRSWYGSFGYRQALFRLLHGAPWSKQFKSFLAGWLVCDRTQQTLWKYAYWIKQLKPRVLEGSPVAFYVLANFLKKAGFVNVDIPVVLSTSETLLSFQRQVIESTFNCRVFNHYGSNEIGSIAQECGDHTGLHINALDRIVEFAKGEQAVTSGEIGETVITDLENYAMPFIRYNIKDVGVPMDGLCSCGRRLPLIKEIKGRVADLILSPEGGFISSDVFAKFIVFRNDRWTQEFQIIQPSTNEILIRIAKSPKRSAKNFEALLEEIRKYLREVDVRTEFVGSITSPPSGKHRFIVSKASQEYFSKLRNSNVSLN